MLALANDDAALPTEIVSEMVPAIRRIAAQLVRRLPSHISIDDLIGAGFVGLVSAYSRFDSARGGDFRPYAEYRIRGAMLDELRSGDPLSRDLRAHAKRIAAAIGVLEQRLGRAPTEEQIAAALGLTLDVYRARRRWVTTIHLVSFEGVSDDETSLQLSDADACPVDEQVVSEESKRCVNEAVRSLPPRLRDVIELYYAEGRSLREIGKRLGVSESRVCQLQKDALERLRERCAGSEEAAKSERRPLAHAVSEAA